ncbi:hypothetical protein BGW36DRAFT_391171 [Talaromyces proteolyticus]|uniref:Uncharacterized protein n=1 Tax=Talaromyces proteolyticus TaxID=1131652 RepID=A0AAD4KDI0_9EURO|nr:uncharacterized protein BGW36DRAFT_391171 [Talaromyces proteolyticus]KAH8689586.1 hypothetical protein BGW36DRAFT_391171 [Talaromyces proteolyticus]
MADAVFASDGIWDTYSSKNQQDRKTWRSIAAQLGRQLLATPTHLSRVLYIPHHDEQTADLSLYDVSDSYARTVADVPMGSSMYTVKLGMMKVPKGEVDTDGLVYKAGFDGDKGFVQGMDSSAAEIKVNIKSMSEKEASMFMLENQNTITSSGVANVTVLEQLEKTPIPMNMTYPIPPSKTRYGEIKHPYFDFEIPSQTETGETSTIEFEWQIHPVENGSLRYTLIRIPATLDTKPSIEAIYHHKGVATSLSLPYSEGVLFLRPTSSVNPSMDILVVGSVLGMLWRLRELNGDGKKSRFAGLKSLMKGK